jgi:Fe2+ or Zn2+ uptake regulation protein
MQRQIALTHGFELTSHRMDLFGVCPRCQRRK